MIHELKTWPPYFDDVASGVKTVELRREDDRNFEVGDTLILREWDPSRIPESVQYDGQSWIGTLRINDDMKKLLVELGYTGRSCRVRVTHVLRDSEGQWLQPDVAALSVRLVTREVTQNDDDW